jgi:uncharacterized membrane protein HdeD (DUF308 family)
MSNVRPVVQLTTANLMAGGVGLLAWGAVGLLMAFNQLPRNWQQLRGASDAAFGAVLLFGPFCFVAGIGLFRQRRWGRTLAWVLGAIAGLLVIAGVALVCAEVLHLDGAGEAGLALPFLAYSVGTFVALWNDPFTATASEVAP